LLSIITILLLFYTYLLIKKMIVSRTFNLTFSCESTRLSKAHDLEIVQIVNKNSVDSHLPDVKGSALN